MSVSESELDDKSQLAGKKAIENQYAVSIC